MTRKSRRSMKEDTLSMVRLREEGERLAGRIRRDAKLLRAGIVKDVRMLRKGVGDRAGRTIRDLERRVLRQFHAATAERVASLEKRIARMERTVADLERRFAEPTAA